MPRDAGGAADGEHLDREVAERQREHRERGLEQHAQVGGHADRHEEEPEQQALEWLDVRLELVAIFAVGEQHAGNERAERHRQADRVEEQGRADHDQQRRRRECFLRAGAGDDAQRRAQCVAPDGDHDHRGHERQRDRLPFERRGARAAEHGQDDEGRHDRQVLEQQDRERGAAVLRGQLAALGEHLQHQRRRRQRERERDHERRGPRQAECARGRSERRGRDRDLQAAGAEYRVAHHPEPRRLQLEPDHEQQQHDAEFGEAQDVLDVLEEPQPPGPDHDAGGEVPEHRAEFEASEQRHGDDRGGE